MLRVTIFIYHSFMITINISGLVLASDRRGSVLPPSPSSLPPAAPPVVRHEMAVSPVKVPSMSRAVSTRTELAKVDVSTQGSLSSFNQKPIFTLSASRS